VFRSVAAEHEASITFVDQQRRLPYPSALAGAHQERNARTAMSALMLLRDRGWSIPEKALRTGFREVVENTGLMGRWQVLGERPRTIADVAHNVDGIRVVRAMLANERYAKLHIVLGMVNDKDLSKVLSELPTEATYYFCKADIPRGLDASVLQDQCIHHGLFGNAHPSVATAYAAARTAATPEDLVLVTGSVFVVAEVV
jgi:dihydrofolate synthase/folylpolyglutamate synthase